MLVSLVEHLPMSMPVTMPCLCSCKCTCLCPPCLWTCLCHVCFLRLCLPVPLSVLIFACEPRPCGLRNPSYIYSLLGWDFLRKCDKIFLLTCTFFYTLVHFVHFTATGRDSCTSKRVCIRTFLTFTARLTVMIQIRYTRGYQLMRNSLKTYGMMYFHYPLNVCWDLVNSSGEKGDKTLNKWTNVSSLLESKSYQGDGYLSAFYIVKRRI